MSMAHNSGLGNLIGGGYLANAANQLGTPYTGSAGNQLGGLANTSSLQNQQSLQRQYMAAQQQAWMPKDWVIDGMAYSMEEFANKLFGDDTPEKTMFLLKYAKDNTKNKDTK